MCQDLQYPVPEPWGIIILLCNIFFGTLGTLIAAYCKHDGFSCGQFWLAVVQSLCFFLIFGCAGLSGTATRSTTTASATARLTCT
jgi:hypothetical protein